MLRTKLKVESFILISLGFIILSTLLNIFLGNTTIDKSIKSLIAVVFPYFYYLVWVEYNKQNLPQIFSLYMKMCIIVIGIGYVQFFSSITNFKWGYDYSWILNKWAITYIDSFSSIPRVNSIMPEPAHYVSLLSPAIFYVIFKLKNGSKNYVYATYLLLGYLLSTSTLGFLVLLVMYAVISIRKIKLLPVISFGVISITATLLAYNNIDLFKQRIDSLLFLSSNNDLNDITTSNVDLSSFTLVNNGYVTFKTILNSPFIGHGFGSRTLSYQRYSFLDPNSSFIDLNVEDGSSLVFRIMSELGLIGMLGFLYFLRKIYIRRAEATIVNFELLELKAINNACIVGLLPFLIRGSSFYLYGVPLYIWLAYYCQIQYDIRYRAFEMSLLNKS